MRSSKFDTFSLKFCFAFGIPHAGIEFLTIDHSVGEGHIGPGVGGGGTQGGGGTNGFTGGGATFVAGLDGQTGGGGGIYILIGNSHVIRGFMMMGRNNNEIIAIATIFSV